MAYDLLIRNARVIDGSGMPSFHGDVAVKDGKIVESGKLQGPAKRTIDAEGRAVAPGFIDNHCHYDAQVTWDPLCTYAPHHGITTVVFGNCSLALAPARPEDRSVLAGMLARVEAIPMEALEQGTRWSWTTIPEYLDAIDQGLGVNAGVLIGHSAVRRWVMGEDSQDRSEATPQELEEMKAIIRDGMAAGALGLSFNRNPGHYDIRGKLLPACIAPHEELVELSSVLSEVGTGVIESGASAPFELREGLMSRMAEASGRPVLYLQIAWRAGAPEQWKDHLAFAEDRINQGIRVYPMVNPRPSINTFTLRNAQLFDRMPSWAPIMTGSIEGKLKAFRDPEVRKVLSAEAVEGVGVNYDIFSRRWDLISVHDTTLEKNRPLIGKSVAQIAQEQGKGILDAFLDLSLEEDMGTEFEAIQLGGDEASMAELLNSPYTVVGLSDAGAHLVFEANDGFSTYFLGHWIREKKIMSLEKAVRRITFDSASMFGMHDRGLIRPGMNADLVIFDPDTIALGPEEKVADLPGGAVRLRRLAKGVDYTIVNGEVLIEGGNHTGALPGKVARNTMYAHA
ncbi:MAG: N-acyl-D-aspartate/D-glutamate deacylase/Predicted amidohydrolase YtcJ/Adenine deaminase [Chloroflexi bacterium]|nr:MAG: N-acyl-D-aspartate/D-glutamate deacylase/Predicted amidohydrolase YtcJ/Adenine deaminase [Chloroflexota bacterium]